MGKDGLWVELMSLSDAKVNSVVSAALDEYYQLLTLVAMDIYDSGIQEFYALYTPKVYRRHGDLAGKNLYAAKDIFYDGNTINMMLDEYNLDKYPGRREKRTIVLEFVLAGLRGGPLPNKPEWPMDWYTSYPNAYSKYGHLWQSSKFVFQDIFTDFCENAWRDMLPRAIASIAKQL